LFFEREVLPWPADPLPSILKATPQKFLIMPISPTTETSHQQRHRISCEVDGNTIEGNYWIAGKILVVSTSKGGSSHQIGSNDHKALAVELLRRLASEGKA
jgi:hypothetical protein